MKYDIGINKEINGDYYIEIYYDYNMFISDDRISELLNISTEFYFKVAKSFKGVLIHESLYFKKENDILGFKDFIETLLVAKELNNS